MKRGDTWVSAVLYIALGTVILTIILTAGLPLLNNLKDKNTFLQTKEVMFGLNNAIRTVINEGPGSQRTVTINIADGEFKIDDTKEEVMWTKETKALIQEPDVPVYEGNIKILTNETFVVDKYILSLSIDYTNIANLSLQGPAVLQGRYNLVITNQGVIQDSTVPLIEIREIS